jgi:hypothetical protein
MNNALLSLLSITVHESKYVQSCMNLDYLLTLIC